MPASGVKDKITFRYRSSPESDKLAVSIFGSKGESVKGTELVEYKRDMVSSIPEISEKAFRPFLESGVWFEAILQIDYAGKSTMWQVRPVKKRIDE